MPDSLILAALLYLIARLVEDSLEDHNKKKSAKRKQNAEQRKGVREIDN